MTAPVNPAIERMREILFRPFNLKKWMAIGFCAWLAYFGRGGYQYNRSTSHHSSLRASLAQARAYVLANLGWIVPLGAGFIVLCLVLWVLFVWLQSRGAFMFLHCVVLKRGEVAAPWREYAREARSVWLFRLGLGAAQMVLTLPVVGIAVWEFLEMGANGRHFGAGDIPVFIAIAVAWACLSLPLWIISVFTQHFVVPIMVLRNGTCMEAWWALLPLLSANAWRFFRYILFQIVIGIVIVFLVIAFVLCTCCVGGVLLAIPYVGSVVLLPVTVFSRSYSLLYLAQYGAEFDVFRVPEEPGVSPALPA